MFLTINGVYTHRKPIISSWSTVIYYFEEYMALISSDYFPGLPSTVPSLQVILFPKNFILPLHLFCL